MRAFVLALLTLVFLPVAATAQSADRPNTILVLDGSGSMWGQIDGINKIVIARNVIAELLENMADDVSLGLTVYGHRQRGSCTDIETIVEPGPFTQDRILEAVNGINPRGRTPMTDAVIAAAQSLRHTEEAATVILVSDGIENCNPDPCAIASELEAAGVAFTAHVIGFDVASEPEARAQMQCIADNTGGQFLTADNAAELSAALEAVTVAALPTAMRIEAQVMPQGTLPTRPISWVLFDEAGAPITSPVQAPAIDAQLMPGTYTAQATRTEPDGPQTYQETFTVIEGQTDLIVVAMPAIVETSQVTFSARVQPDMTPPISALSWTLYDATGTVLFGPVDAPGGNVALLPGDYRLEVLRANTGQTHEARFTVEPNTPQEVVIPLPAILVDVTFVARIGDVGGLPVTDPVVWDVDPLMSNPVTTNPAVFQMGRGAYRVTAYWTAQEIEQTLDFVIADQAREIVVVFPEPVPTATITAPATAIAGSTIEVAWSGPEEANDFIAIRRPDAEGYHRFANTSAITDGNPLRLLMPIPPGDYVIEYIRADGRVALASAPITVTPVTATVTAAETAVAGSTIEVAWTGPAYRNDFIAVRSPDAEGYHRFVNQVRVENGVPVVTLQMPTDPGTYIIEYIENQDRSPLGSMMITVEDVSATITAPATAPLGSTIDVGWTGPAYRNDFISIRSPDAEGYHRFINETRVEDGEPVARLLMPSAVGTYVIEYIEAQDRTPLAVATIEITPVEVSLTAPGTAGIGQTVEVGWIGPDYDNDFIAIRTPDAEGYHRFINQTRTSDGQPARLLMPTEPGTYVIDYILSQDRIALASVQIIVDDVAATITAPTSAVAGSTIEVAWTGPDERDDYIGIGRRDRNGNPTWENYAYTRDGSTLRLLVPPEPGEYEITYFLRQDRVDLVSVPITVTPAEASITVPATAEAGSTIEVVWTGPDYRDDYIGIGQLDRDGNPTWENYTRTADGSPLRLLVPSTPGEYYVTYFMQQERTALTSVPLTVTDVAASITAPATATVGSTIEVVWTGPDYNRDFIGIGRAGAEGGEQWENYTRTADGSPLRLLMPVDPGTYVIRYFVDQDRVVLAEAQITLTPIAASITAPATAVAGSTIEVAWTGPDYPRDFIGIGRAGAEGGEQWENYTRTDQGSPLRLLTPTEAGTYVIRYFVDQDRVVQAEAQITLTAPEGSLTAPASAPIGSTVDVAWSGPNYPRDFIGVGRAGAGGGDMWENYTRTDQGNPIRLLMPVEPGSYVIRYFIDQDRTIVAETPITLTDIAATIVAPATAPAGGTVEISWTGPDYRNDFIALGPVDAEGGERWQSYERTDRGSTLTLNVPEQPGAYMLRYFLDQDRRVIGETPITVQ